MSEEHLPFGDDFLSLIEFMQGQDPVLQWIVGALIIALTVGMIVFTVYMMKLVITTIIKMIKGAVKVGKAGVGYNNHGSIPLHASPQGQQISARAPVNQPVYQQMPVNQPVQTNQNQQMSANQQAQAVEIKTDYFCSNCGNKFTDMMIETIKKNERVYCEYCGQGFMVDKQ